MLLRLLFQLRIAQILFVKNSLNKIIEENRLDLSWILGISMEGCLGDMRILIREILNQEKEKHKQQGVNKTRKKNLKPKGV